MLEKEKDLKVYYADFDPSDEGMGVMKVSIVESPAIESNFVALNVLTEKVFLTSNEDKQTVTGALLIPDKKILRVDPLGDYFNLVFDEKTIERLRDKFHKDNYTHQVNLDHETDVSDVYLIESWIKKSEKDKSVEMGLDLPIGSWVATYKVEDKSLFEKMKTKNYNGFSIEAFLDKNTKINNTKNKMKKNTFLNILAKLAELVSVKGAIPELDKDFVDNADESNVNLPQNNDGENIPPVIEAVVEDGEVVIVEQPKVEELPTMEVIYAQYQTLMATHTNLLNEMETMKARIDALESMDMEKNKKVEDLEKENTDLKKEKEVYEAKMSKLESEDATEKLKVKTKPEDVPNWKRFSETLKSLK